MAYQLQYIVGSLCVWVMFGPRSMNYLSQESIIGYLSAVI